MNIPERTVNPGIQMYDEALGKAPGRGRMAGRHVLVVGAGQRDIGDENAPVGNGRAISILLAREGAKVACADVDQESLAKTVSMVEAEGGEAIPLIGDVADPDKATDLVFQAGQKLGQLDGLVLNVGLSHALPLDKMTAETWDREFAINLRSHMLMGKAALEVLQPGSSIILVSSLASQRPTGRNPAYETSKAAQLALSRSIAMAGQEKGIRCNAIAPGLIDTPMGRAASSRRPERAQVVPFGRQGTGWEVAYSMLFLLSHESSYVNGHALFVDGGLGQHVLPKM